MRIKNFNPAIDGLPSCLILPSLELETNKIQSRLDSAFSEVLVYLQQTYKGAIDVYEIPIWLKGWLEIYLVEDYFKNLGLLHMLLDHYYTRNFPPRKFKKSTSRKALKFQSYLAGRTLDSVSPHTGEQLKAVAISKFMPDSWVQKDVLVDTIKDEIKSIYPFLNPKVELNLQIPKSGKNWVEHKTLQEVEKLKINLDNCSPQIITIITKSNTYSHVDHTVIAYDYQFIKENLIEIFIYSFNDQQEKKSIHIYLKPFKIRSQLHNNIEGFYIENYTCGTIPMPWWQRFLHFSKLWILYWYFKRLILLLSLRSKQN